VKIDSTMFRLFDEINNARTPCGQGCCARSVKPGQPTKGFPRGMRGDLDRDGVMIVTFNPKNQLNDIEAELAKRAKVEGSVDSTELFRCMTARLMADRYSGKSPVGERLNRLVKTLKSQPTPIACYVTNAVKCDSTTAQEWFRGERREAATNCVRRFLARECEMLRPKVMLVLGRDVLRLLVAEKSSRAEMRRTRTARDFDTPVGRVRILYHSHPSARGEQAAEWTDRGLKTLVRRVCRVIGRA
jgi:uracil-DNA glycosylase family 4